MPHVTLKPFQMPFPALPLRGRAGPDGLMMAVLDAAALLIIPLFWIYSIGAGWGGLRNAGLWVMLDFITIGLTASYGGYRPVALPKADLAIGCFWISCAGTLAFVVLLGHAGMMGGRWVLAYLSGGTILLFSLRQLPRWTVLPAATTPAGPVVICCDASTFDLGGALQAHDLAGPVSAVHYLHDSAPPPTDLPVLGTAAALLEMIAAQQVRDVIFIHHAELERLTSRHEALISDLLASPVRIWLAVNLAPELSKFSKSRRQPYQLMPLVDDRVINSRNITKRSFDLVFGIALLALFMPLVMIVAVVLASSGARPVVFRQTRTGAHNRAFTVLKFSTMLPRPTPDYAQAVADDPRVTRIGRFLRKTSLDEILQLFNVIRGDMSLVGPRPHAPQTKVEGIDFESAVKFYRLRHRVKPGMTGLAQIRGQRGQTLQVQSLENRISSDLEYIESWSLGLDIRIMLRTLPAVLSQKNAW